MREEVWCLSSAHARPGEVVRRKKVRTNCGNYFNNAVYEAQNKNGTAGGLAPKNKHFLRA
jgi:hypothetical protein